MSEIIGVYSHIHPDDRHDMLRFLDNALKVQRTSSTRKYAFSDKTATVLGHTST